MIGDLIKIFVIILISALWLMVTYLAWSSASQIWKIKQPDWGLTLRLIGRTVSKSPFAAFVGQVRERADLEVSLAPREGYTFVPKGGQFIDTEAFLRERRQYSLIVANQSDETFEQVSLRIRFPYPVSDSQVSDSRGASTANFSPVGLLATVTGQITVRGRPVTSVYELSAGELLPRGKIEVLLLLNSWRDPRGKVIPKGQEAFYSVPESGPSITYIFGQFRYRVEGELIEREYYAPLLVDESKIVSLGPPSQRPKVLRRTEGMEMEELW